MSTYVSLFHAVPYFIILCNYVLLFHVTYKISLAFYIGTLVYLGYKLYANMCMCTPRKQRTRTQVSDTLKSRKRDEQQVRPHSPEPNQMKPIRTKTKPSLRIRFPRTKALLCMPFLFPFYHSNRPKI